MKIDEESVIISTHLRFVVVKAHLYFDVRIHFDENLEYLVDFLIKTDILETFLIRVLINVNISLFMHQKTPLLKNPNFSGSNDSLILHDYHTKFIKMHK